MHLISLYIFPHYKGRVTFVVVFHKKPILNDWLFIKSSFILILFKKLFFILLLLLLRIVIWYRIGLLFYEVFVAIWLFLTAFNYFFIDFIPLLLDLFSLAKRSNSDFIIVHMIFRFPTDQILVLLTETLMVIKIWYLRTYLLDLLTYILDRILCFIVINNQRRVLSAFQYGTCRLSTLEVEENFVLCLHLYWFQ